jgi:hypothetical protein
MARWHPRDWVEDLAPDFSDAGSFRHMRRFATEELNNNNRIRAEIVAANGEQTAIDEWDTAFEAVVMIDAKMKALGIPL